MLLGDKHEKYIFDDHQPSQFLSTAWQSRSTTVRCKRCKCCTKNLYQ